MKQSRDYIHLSMCRYSASVITKQSSYEDYNLKYKSVTMTVTDKDLFSSLGFSCDKSVKKNKSYNVQYVSIVMVHFVYK